MPTLYSTTAALLFLILVLLPLASAAVHHRRILHQPFFPQDSSPPILSPPPTPDLNETPFFPSYPSPPPPPPTASSPSVPNSVSSLGAKPKSLSYKLIAGAVAAVISAVIVVSLAVFLHLRKKSRRSPAFENFKNQRSDTDSSATESHSAPNNQHKIPKLQRPSQTSSEFLYLGTLANSNIPAASGDTSDTRKMDSPELRPLPPLNAQHSSRPHYRNNAYVASSKGDEDEEFYSPKGSLNGRDSSADTGSASRRAFASIEVENFIRFTSNSSSTCSSSNSRSGSGSPVRSVSSSLSPANSLSSRNSIPKSPDLKEMQTIERLYRGSISKGSPSPSPPSSSSLEGYESSPLISNVSHNNLSVTPTPSPPAPPNLQILLAPPPVPVPPPPPPPPSMSKVWENSRTPTPPGKKPISGPPPAPITTPLRPVPVNKQSSITPFKLTSNGSISDEKGNKISPVNEIEHSGKPKLKPLHWDKVKASSDREMVWDQLQSSSFKLNEEMIETLFVANASQPNLNTRWQVLPSSDQDNGNRVLDSKKAQNIAIMLRALNVTVEEVCEGLLEGNTEILGPELLESLLKMAPTKEEERKLKEYKDVSPTKLGVAERFLKAILDIPHTFRRVDAMLYVSNFESEADYLKKAFETLETACEELRTSRMFLKLLEAVLKTGNRMNVGTNRGDAHAFKLDTLLKLVDVKGADGKTTLLHFVVQEIIKIEGARLNNGSATDGDAKCRKLGLRVVSTLVSELSNVKKAANMDAEVLSSDVCKLSKGIHSIAEVVRLNEGIGLQENGTLRFCESMNAFVKKAEEKIITIQAQESVALSLVKEITEYFHGNSAREEAHPFRIFMVVRDFLTVLDRVCKEIGMINERTVVSSANKFVVPVNPMLQKVTGGFSNRQ